MDNKFEVRGKYTAIFIKNSDGEFLESIISTMDLEKVRDFIGYWYATWSEGTDSYYAQGYGCLNGEEKRTTSLHRFIMDEPKGFVVDHINHDTLDNTYPNLRVVSQSVNALNRKNAGVTKYKGKWQAKFTFKGKVYHLGYFDTEEEARRIVAKEKGEFIEKEAFEDEYENEIQEIREGLGNDKDFHVHTCENCGSQSDLVLNGIYDDRGNMKNLFIDCSNCGAEQVNNDTY